MMSPEQRDRSLLRQIKAAGSVGGLFLVTHSEGSFWAIFDREAFLSIDGSVESRNPALTAARTSDVCDLPKDAVLDIGGAEYRIKRHEPDGTGMSLVILKR